ncbi:MAG TPA: ribonuclease HII [Anaerolineaceae bacterium]|nr:ribonuclease HII [Anaerolineaceae bacterium]
MARSRTPPAHRPTLEHELQLWQQGYHSIAGLDEAGRGAWAGPVFAAAVILPHDERILQLLNGVNDSKKMTPHQRERWQGCIKAASLDWAIGSVSNQEIDQMGIVAATRAAMLRALAQLRYKADHLLIDYMRLTESNLPQICLPKGDSLCLSIAAASILAKTARDALMIEIDSQYPTYGFAAHKGYGTARHRTALQTTGLCEIHRVSFEPMRSVHGN